MPGYKDKVLKFDREATTKWLSRIEGNDVVF